MARVFISHSSRDGEPAARIKTWLQEQGFETPFLDFDKHAGIAPGADWEKTLYREIEQSEAIIIVQTPNWLDSKWCFAEYTQARALGKAIFPVIEAPTGETLIASDIQALDLLKDREGGLEQLSKELTRIALDAQGGFTWDSSRPPYPGLHAFQEEDAALYFGRDDDIRRLIERLNARRAQGGTKLIALLGASGSGKSSLLRAGVIPRIKRDKRNWIVLPPMRPQAHPVDGLARMIAVALKQGADWRSWRDQLSGADVARALNDLASDLRIQADANEAQILIPVDQAEELFGAAVPEEADRFFEILNVTMSEDLPYLAVLAQRSDYLEKLQSAEKLTARFEEFSLSPLPLARIPQIIEGPARVAGLGIEDGLVLQASKDAQTEDALPLLAFALRELYDRYGDDNYLSLDEYHLLGDAKEGLTPLENAVRKAADDVLAEAQPSDEELTALREAFVPAMVRVNEQGEYVRQPAHWDELPGKSHSLLERLAKARLLIIRQDGDARMVEVAHEALLRKWPRLRDWLDDAREFLTGKQQLQRDLHDWERATEADKTGALLTGLKLNRARGWLLERPHQLTAQERALVQASIDHAEAEERRKARMRRNITRASIAAALVLACIAGIAAWQRVRAVNALTAGTETAESMVVSLAREFRDQEGISSNLVLQILERALALQRRLTELGGNSPRLRNGISSALSEAAQTYLQTGSSDAKAGIVAARDAASEARNIILPLVAAEPENVEWAGSLIRADIALGDALLRLGDQGAAFERFRDSLANAEKMAGLYPLDFTVQRDLALSLNRVADSLVPSGKTEDALAHYERSLKKRESLLDAVNGKPGREEDVILLLRDLAVSYVKVGDLLRSAGRDGEAIALYEKSQKLRQDLVNMAPTNTKYQRDRAAGFQRLGASEFRFLNFERALAHFEEAQQIQAELSRLDPGRLDWRFDLSVTQENIADTFLELDRLVDARSALQSTLSLRDKLVARDSENRDWKRSLSVAARKMGAILHRAGDAQDAIEHLTRALQISLELSLEAPGNVQLRLDVILALIGLSKAGDGPQARLTQALEIVQELESAGTLPKDKSGWPAEIKRLLEQSSRLPL